MVGGGGGDIGAAAGCSAGARIKHHGVRTSSICHLPRARFCFCEKGKMRRKKHRQRRLSARRLGWKTFFLLLAANSAFPAPLCSVRALLLIPRRLCAEFIIIMLLREMSPYVGALFFIFMPAAWR